MQLVLRDRAAVVVPSDALPVRISANEAAAGVEHADVEEVEGFTPARDDRIVTVRLDQAAVSAARWRGQAMERKIERGDWVEGKVWRRAPDGHIMIDVQGYQRWVESQ